MTQSRTGAAAALPLRVDTVVLWAMVLTAGLPAALDPRRRRLKKGDQVKKRREAILETLNQPARHSR
jgi:hypothetical protein